MYPNIEQQSSTMQSGGKQQTLEGGGGKAQVRRLDGAGFTPLHNSDQVE